MSDETDILAWLRHEERSWDDNFGPGGGDIFKLPADEIERLRAVNARLSTENGMLREDLASLDDLYVLRRRKHNEAAAEIERLRAALLRMVATSGRLTATDGSSDALFLLLDARTHACAVLDIDPTGETPC